MLKKRFLPPPSLAMELCPLTDHRQSPLCTLVRSRGTDLSSSLLSTSRPTDTSTVSALPSRLLICSEPAAPYITSYDSFDIVVSNALRTFAHLSEFDWRVLVEVEIEQSVNGRRKVYRDDWERTLTAAVLLGSGEMPTVHISSIPPPLPHLPTRSPSTSSAAPSYLTP
jgi:hypothetical protein